MKENNLLDVLREIKVTKPEEIDKYNAVQLANLFPKLTESAFQTLFNQVPNFFKLLEDGLMIEKEVIIKSLDNNAVNMISIGKNFDIVLDTLRECQKKSITLEESKYYIEKMFEVLEMAGKKDSENKAFIERNVKLISDSKNGNRALALSLLAGVVGVGLVALGIASDNHFLTKQVTKKASDKIVGIIEKNEFIK